MPVVRGMATTGMRRMSVQPLQVAMVLRLPPLLCLGSSSLFLLFLLLPLLQDPAMRRAEAVADADIVVPDIGNQTYHLQGYMFYDERAELAQHFRLAVDLVNNQTDGLWDDLNLTRSLSLVVNDTECNELTTSILNYKNSWLGDVVGIVGGYCSAASGVIAEQTAANPYGPPQISPASTAPSLSDYAYFMRVVPSDVAVTKAAAAIMKRFGWTNVGVIYEDDTYGRGVNSSFGEIVALEPNISIVTAVPVTFSEAATEYAEALSELRRLGTRVVFMCVHAITAAKILEVGSELNLLVGEDYQYVGCDAWTDASLFAADDSENGTSTASSLVDVASGYLGILPFINTSRDMYNEYLRRWKASDLPDADGNRSTVDTFAAPAVDAVLAIAHAVQAVEVTVDDNGDGSSTADPYDRDTLTQAILNVSFSGVSGWIEFNRETRATPRSYEIVNALDGEWTTVGIFSPDDEDLSITSTVTFVDGTSTPLEASVPVSVHILVFVDGTMNDSLEVTGHVARVVDMVNNKTDGFFDSDSTFGQAVEGFVISAEFHDGNCSADTTDQIVSQNLSVRPSSAIDDIAAIVGPYCTASAQAIAPWADNFSIPVVTIGAITDAMTANYSLLLRAAPTNADVADAIVVLAKLMNWDNVLCLLQSDDPTSAELYNLINAATSAVILTTQSFTSDTNDDNLVSRMETLQDGKTSRIVLVLVSPGQQLSRVLRLARENNVLAPQSLSDDDSSHVWVGTSGLMAGDILLEFGDWLVGSVAVALPAADPGSRYLQTWSSVASAAEYADADGDRRNLSANAVATHDATLSVLSAINAMFGSFPDYTDGVTLAEYLVDPDQVVRSLNGDDVSFDDRNGNRDTALVVVNLVERANKAQRRYRWLPTHSMYDGESTVLRNVEWAGGNGNDEVSTGEDDEATTADDDGDEASRNTNNNGVLSAVRFALLGVALLVLFGMGIFIARGRAIHLKHEEEAPNQHKRRRSVALTAAEALEELEARNRRKKSVRGLTAVGSSSPPGATPPSPSKMDAIAAELASLSMEDLEMIHNPDDPKLVAAALHCHSALIGLPPEPLREVKPITYALFRYYFSSIYQNYVFTGVCVVHLGLALWEQASAHDSASAPSKAVSTTLLAVELICVVVYLLDIYVHMQLFPNNTTHSKKYLLYLLVVTVVAVDSILHFVATDLRLVRFSRPLRAVMIPLHSRSMENDLRKLLRSMRGVLDLGLVFLVFVALSGAIAVAAFGPTVAQCHLSETPPDMSSLMNLGDAFLTFFTMMSGDNFPQASYPTQECLPRVSRSFSVLFFAVVALFEALLLAIMVASLYNEWLAARKVQVGVFRERERENLKQAFASISGNKPMTFVQWHVLISRLQPQVPFEMIRETFEIIDEDGNGTLELEEFLQVSSVLLNNVTVVDKSNTDSSASGSTPRSPGGAGSLHFDSPVGIGSPGTKQRRASFDVRAKTWKMHGVLEQWLPGSTLTGFVSANLYVIGVRLALVLGNWVLVAFYTASNRTQWSRLNLWDNGFMVLAILDVAVQLYSMGWTIYTSKPYLVVDASCTAVSSVLVGICELTGAVRVGTCFRFLRLLRTLYAFDQFAMYIGKERRFKTRRILRRLVLAGPLILRLLLILFALIYAFSTIGMELWAGRLANCSHGVCEPKREDLQDGHTNFESLPSALLVVLSNFLDASMSNIVQVTMSVSGWPGAIYWAVLYLTLPMAFFNVLTAVLVDGYDSLWTRDRNRKVKHERYSCGVVRITPSDYHHRFRTDLDLEDARLATQEKAVRDRDHLSILSATSEQHSHYNVTQVLDAAALRRKSTSHMSVSSDTPMAERALPSRQQQRQRGGRAANPGVSGDHVILEPRVPLRLVTTPRPPREGSDKNDDSGGGSSGGSGGAVASTETDTNNDERGTDGNKTGSKVRSANERAPAPAAAAAAAAAGAAGAARPTKKSSSKGQMSPQSSHSSIAFNERWRVRGPRQSLVGAGAPAPGSTEPDCGASVHTDDSSSVSSPSRSFAVPLAPHDALRLELTELVPEADPRDPSTLGCLTGESSEMTGPGSCDSRRAFPDADTSSPLSVESVASVSAAAAAADAPNLSDTARPANEAASPSAENRPADTATAGSNSGAEASSVTGDSDSSNNPDSDVVPPVSVAVVVTDNNQQPEAHL